MSATTTTTSVAPVRVAHFIGGEHWAGAEAQMAHLLAGLQRSSRVQTAAILLSDRQLAAELRRAGVPTTIVDEPALGRSGVVAAVARELRRLETEVLHTHGYKETILGAVAGRRAGVRRFVKTEHGRLEPWSGWDRMKMTLYRRLDHGITRFGIDRVIAVSGEMHAHLSSWLPGQRVALIRNGLDPKRVCPAMPAAEVRRALGVAPEAPVFVTVGRLMPVKGLGYLLEAMPRVLSTLPTARLLIVGEGEQRAELELSVRRLGLDHAVRILGFRDDVIDILNAADVFVMPSLHEGLPIALLEALALGKSVVASAVGGIPEVLREVSGWLVPPRDTSALALACLDAVRNTGRQDASVVAKRIAELSEQAETMCETTVALYVDLAARDRTVG